jgi:hypothetical protein
MDEHTIFVRREMMEKFYKRPHEVLAIQVNKNNLRKVCQDLVCAGYVTHHTAVGEIHHVDFIDNNRHPVIRASIGDWIIFDEIEGHPYDAGLKVVSDDDFQKRYSPDDGKKIVIRRQSDAK